MGGISYGDESVRSGRTRLIANGQVMSIIRPGPSPLPRSRQNSSATSGVV